MKNRIFSFVTLLVVASSMLMLTACSAPERLAAVPDDATMRAEIPGMPGVRYVLPEGAAAMYPDIRQAVEYGLAARVAAGLTGPLPPRPISSPCPAAETTGPSGLACCAAGR